MAYLLNLEHLKNFGANFIKKTFIKSEYLIRKIIFLVISSTIYVQ